MEGVEGQCLICQLPVENEKAVKSALLEKQLEVMFLLRKVLKAPHSLLSQFLEESREPVVGQVENWIDICGNCRPLLEECRGIHEKLCELNRQWEECRAKVVTKVKETAGTGPETGSTVSRETRRFVINQADDPVVGVNPFVEGDWRAEELDRKRRMKVTPKAEGPKLKRKRGAESTQPEGQEEEEEVSVIEYWRRLKAAKKDDPLKGVKVRRDPNCPCCHGVGFCKLEWMRLQQHWNKERKAALPRPFECPQCQKTFRYSGHRDHHVRKVHEKAEMVWPCVNQCGREFRRKYELQWHNKNVCQGRYVCEECGQVFYIPGSLEIHKEFGH